MHVRGPIKLTEAQLIEAADLLRSGLPWAHVSHRFDVAENTLRRYIKDIGPRQVKADYPTEAARYEHGFVRWDLPLGTTKDGTHRTVLVEVRVRRTPHLDDASYTTTVQIYGYVRVLLSTGLHRSPGPAAATRRPERESVAGPSSALLPAPAIWTEG